MSSVCRPSHVKYDAYAPAYGSDALSSTAINTASKMLKYSFRGWISNASFTFKGVFGSALGEEEGN